MNLDPSNAKLILYAFAGVFCVAGTYFAGKFLAGWGNEIKNSTDSALATQSRIEANKSDQALNAQTANLPKD